MISSARFPFDGISALIMLRADPSLQIHVNGDQCWAQWPVERTDILECMRPIRGVEFFEYRQPYWYRHGDLLPASVSPPEGRGESLIHHLSPEIFKPIPNHVDPLVPVKLQLVPSSQPHHATAIRCSLDDLSRWVESATTSEIRTLRAARSNTHAILLGQRLPVIPLAERFWGDVLLLPLGYRLEPELPVTMIREALNVNTGEHLFFEHGGSFVVPSSAFESITRSGIRSVRSS